MNTNATNLVGRVNISGCGSIVGVTATAPRTGGVTITASTARSAGNAINIKTTSSLNFQIAA